MIRETTVAQEQSEARRAGIGSRIWAFFVTGWGTYLITAVSLVIFVLVWDLISGGATSSVILPSPLAVGKALLDVPTMSRFLPNFWTTLQEMIVGFAIGAGAGLFLGFMCIISPLFRRSLQPYIVFFQAIPKIALVPLIFVWFGLGMTSKIALASMQSFFPIFVNAVLGLTLLPEAEERLMYSLGANRFQRFRMLQLPNALPLIFAGIKTGLTYAFISVIVAEFLGGSTGLGSMITAFDEANRVDRTFAVIVILSILSLVIFYGIEYLGRKLVFWDKRKENMPSL